MWFDSNISSPYQWLMYNNPFNQRLQMGWFQDFAVYYLDLGEVPCDSSCLSTNPVYIFIHGFNSEGIPLVVESQNNLLTSIPIQKHYSPFCNAVFVEVPMDYIPNSVRSEKQLKESGYILTKSDLVLLYPVL